MELLHHVIILFLIFVETNILCFIMVAPFYIYLGHSFNKAQKIEFNSNLKTFFYFVFHIYVRALNIIIEFYLRFIFKIKDYSDSPSPPLIL